MASMHHPVLLDEAYLGTGARTANELLLTLTSPTRVGLTQLYSTHVGEEV